MACYGMKKRMYGLELIELFVSNYSRIIIKGIAIFDRKIK